MDSREQGTFCSGETIGGLVFCKKKKKKYRRMLLTRLQVRFWAFLCTKLEILLHFMTVNIFMAIFWGIGIRVFSVFSRHGLNRYTFLMQIRAVFTD